MRKKGFTLIELMIIVAIIGILSAIAIPNLLRFQRRAQQDSVIRAIAAIVADAKANGAPEAFMAPLPNGLNCDYSLSTDPAMLNAFTVVAECDLDKDGDYAYYAYFHPSASGEMIRDPLYGCESGVWNPETKSFVAEVIGGCLPEDGTVHF